MHLTEFDFTLPEDLIALRPMRPRRSARLLVSDGSCLLDRRVSDLPTILRPGDRLIFNDTRVLPAFLKGIRYRESVENCGAAVTANLDKPVSEGVWTALVKPAKKLRDGDHIDFGINLTAVAKARHGAFHILDFACSNDELLQKISSVGAMPLPPYISAKRRTDEADIEAYQTIFADEPGAVAAPTAALHFDTVLLQELADKGIKTTLTTLHVGAGTFLPIRTELIEDHRMHSERGEISEKAAEQINQTLAEGQRAIAVGTTALRLLETAAQFGRVKPWKGQTDIYIRPGFQFQIVSGLVTNFHLPKSSLLVLVAALVGLERMRQIYRHAVSNRYRFYSYGDSSLLLR